ncbi:MAG: ribosome-associated translation inhibitor RaiA [Candidatus Eisenbacteria bacterium]|nr:ribosome-associated translation inhibitor RaiA [Candidatus Eisenbacteria bacterium]
MEITTRSKNFTASPAIRSYTEEKLSKLEKYSKKLVEAHVMFSLERYRHIAEVVLRLNGGDITSRAESNDMYSSIDTVVDKLERMLNKRKDKVTSRRQRGSLKESGAKLETLGKLATLRPKKVVPRQMTVEEAMDALERSREDILIFVNAATERTTVLQKRGDGNFALMEPVS